MTISITVHRGTRAIGGSCIELSTPDGHRLILDAGRPLDAARDATGLLPATLDLCRPADVLFSHPHMDHWGLIDELPTNWTVWAGSKAAELMRLTVELFGGALTRPIRTWDSRGPALRLGPFTVTPLLTDHSAVDAYMLLVEAHGRRVLYTGDFRLHGRKKTLVEAMIARPPGSIDALIMEGTNLGTDKPTLTESALEDAFVDLATRTPRNVFVQWSAQNIDRTVTLFRAARRSGRTLVIDLYAADVLMRIADGTRLPRPGPAFPEMKVVITPGGARLYRRQGRGDFVDRMVRSGVATSRSRLRDGRAIIMTRNSMLTDYQRDGLGFTEDDAYAFSNWRGYLDPDDPAGGWRRARDNGAETIVLHTSGHAGVEDLSRFAAAMAPKALIPVHGLGWDAPAIPLPPVQGLSDGETWPVP